MTRKRVFDLGIVGVHSAGVTLGEEIRRARELKGLTQDELAAAVNVSLNTVGNWENDRSSPRGRLAKVRAVLEMDDDPNDTAELGPPLRLASHAELLTELARRLEEGRPARDLPDVPPGRYRWSKAATPSGRRSQAQETQRGDAKGQA